MHSRSTGLLSVLVWILLVAPYAAAQAGNPAWAVVDGEVLTEADVRETAAEELKTIENERLQFEASSRQKEHQALKAALDGMIADRLLRTEAEKRGIPVSELLAVEVEANTPEPTEAQMENIYQLNQQQLAGVPREAAMAQVRQFLIERAYDATLESFVADLREQYGVESSLGPYRVALETAGHPARGPDDAPVTVVEFSDFECPFCRRTQPALERLQSEYGSQVRLVYRQFPLTDIHPRAQKAAEASLCAADQGRFWEMHDALFAEPIELEVASLKFKATDLGLDTAAFNQCLDSGRYAGRVREDLKAGMAAGVTGTPTIYINGRPVSGAQEFSVYAAVIEEELERLQ